MSHLRSICKDKVCLIKANGEKYEDISAQVGRDKILVPESKLPIEEGDKFTRTLPNGLEETYEVIDRGYFGGHPGIEAYYGVTVRRVTQNAALSATLQVNTVNEFISLVNYPDDFYKNLIEEINFQYTNKRPISLSIVIRKLFENLIIDIFKKKYGTKELSLYYNISKGRFNDFSVLLKNLEFKMADFHYISTNIDKDFIKELNKYREHGNSGAHSIDVNMKLEYYTKQKDDINHKVQLLIRVYNLV